MELKFKVGDRAKINPNSKLKDYVPYISNMTGEIIEIRGLEFFSPYYKVDFFESKLLYATSRDLQISTEEDNKFNIYDLYKRIMKRHPNAIEEIKTLEDAKTIISMITGNAYINSEIYNELNNINKN